MEWSAFRQKEESDIIEIIFSKTIKDTDNSQ
jgi:hypothetical protein